MNNKRLTMNNKRFKQTKIPKYKYIIALIFAFLTVILPLVVKLKALLLSKDLLTYFPANSGYITDIALYYKNILFIVLVALLTLIFVGERIYPDTPVKTAYSKYETNKSYLILCGLFLLSIFISFLFSKSKEVSLLGAPNSYEGTLTWLGYILLFILSINYFDELFYRKYLFKALTIIFVALSIFGLVEFFYKSPLEMPLFQYFILPREYWGQIGSLNITSYFGQISLTLFNPNYVGQLLVLGIPILLSIGLIKPEKRWHRAFFSALTGLAMFVLILSGVSAAIYAFIIGCVVMLVLHPNKQFYKRVALSFLVTFILIIITSPIKETRLISAILADFSNESQVSGKPFHIKEINLERDGVVFTGSETQFKVQYDEDINEFSFWDLNYEPITYIREDDTYIFAVENEVEIKLKQYDNYFSVDLGYKGPMHFAFIDGQYYAIGVNGYLIDEINNDYTDLSRSTLNFATGRGYIWSLVLPLLKETLFVGYGADSLIFHIPQDDFVGKLNFHGSPSMIIDKPHNMFLQIGLSFGLFSLICFVLILGLYFKSSYTIFKNRKKIIVSNRNLYIIYLGILTGILSYLICGVFYDSSITIAPFFWIIFGMGVSINNKLMLIDSSN